MFCRYCIQNVKDGIPIQVYNSINESVSHSSQFISEKVKKHLRKCKAQFREKLRTLRLRQNDGFLIKKKTCTHQGLRSRGCLRGLKALKFYLGSPLAPTILKIFV